MPALEHVEITGPADDHVLHVRVRAEFMEMPGLKLTLPQAARLFALDAGRCALVFNQLVARGVLAAAGGTFMRADAGRRQA
jgi:hypothetical protein